MVAGPQIPGVPRLTTFEPEIDSTEDDEFDVSERGPVVLLATFENRTGIWTVEPVGDATPLAIATVAQPTPLGGTFVGVGGDPNAAGNVAFRVNSDGGIAFIATDDADLAITERIWVADPDGALTAVVAIGDAAPGRPTFNFSQFTGLFYGADVTFTAIAEDANGERITGVWGRRVGQVEVIAATEPEAEGSLASVQRVAANRFGGVAFWAVRNEMDQFGDFIGRGSLEAISTVGTRRTLIRQDDPPPSGDGKFASANNIAISDDDRVAMIGVVRVGAAEVPTEIMLTEVEGSGLTTEAINGAPIGIVVPGTVVGLGDVFAAENDRFGYEARLMRGATVGQAVVWTNGLTVAIDVVGPGTVVRDTNGARHTVASAGLFGNSKTNRPLNPETVACALVRLTTREDGIACQLPIQLSSQLRLSGFPRFLASSERRSRWACVVQTLRTGRCGGVSPLRPPDGA